jgi:drug/metabolite transporter (DMT)-like permease
LGNLTPATFGLLLFSISLGSIAQLCLKIGLKLHPIHGAHSPLQTIANIVTAMLTPWVLTGLLIYGFSTFIWLLLISRVRLSVVYPMISISYVIVMFLSVLILHEPVVWTFAVGGLVFIGAGVSFIGLGMGQAGSG